MTQLSRHENRVKEEQQKEFDRKAQELRETMNALIIKYERLIEVIIKHQPNGSLLPVRIVRKAKKNEVFESVKFLHQNSVREVQKKFSFFPSRDFLNELEAEEERLGVEIAPAFGGMPFGLFPSYVFREKRKKAEEKPVE